MKNAAWVCLLCLLVFPWALAPGIAYCGDDNSAHMEIDGTVTEVLPNGKFLVTLNNNHRMIAKLSGKMRKYYIRIYLGDRVRVQVSPYDPDRGVIVYKYK